MNRKRSQATSSGDVGGTSRKPPPGEALQRRRAAALAGHRGDGATARGFLTDPAPGVRATALEALARAGALRPDDLAAGLTDEAPEVRRRAVELAARWPGPGPPRLAPRLDDEDLSVVEAAAWASGERQPPETGIVTRLAQLATDHDDPLCREAAVAALGAIGDPAGLPAILTATRDRPPVRRRAVLALAPFDGPEVDAALRRALDDRDWQVRQAAEDVLPRSAQD
jgi:HEAT repeat protein